MWKFLDLVFIKLSIWIRFLKVRLIASGVSKNTSFNFFEKNGTAAPTSYYFIDDIEVRLLD